MKRDSDEISCGSCVDVNMLTKDDNKELISLSYYRPRNKKTKEGRTVVREY